MKASDLQPNSTNQPKGRLNKKAIMHKTTPTSYKGAGEQLVQPAKQYKAVDTPNKPRPLAAANAVKRTKPTNYKRKDTVKPMTQKAYNALTKGQKNRLPSNQLPKKMRVFNGSESHDEIMNELDKQMNKIREDHTNKKTHQIDNDFTK